MTTKPMNPPSSVPSLVPELAQRLRALEQELGDPQLQELREALEKWREDKAPPSWRGAPLDAERLRDGLSTRLMEAFRVTGSPAAFGLLYELNYRSFLAAITSRLRKFYFAIDPQDVLQEVFFNIYRYPHKFSADREKAFRYWASMIVRNTVYKSTRDKDRELTHEHQDEEIDERPDSGGSTNPLGRAILEESRRFCGATYRLYLSLYLAAYEQLSARERRALHLVEVEGLPYKAAAVGLKIRLENLKMVIFRARKKILRSLDRAMSSVDSWRPDMVEGRRGVLSRISLPGSPGMATARRESAIVPLGSRPHAAAERRLGAHDRESVGRRTRGAAPAPRSVRKAPRNGPADDTLDGS